MALWGPMDCTQALTHWLWNHWASVLSGLCWKPAPTLVESLEGTAMSGSGCPGFRTHLCPFLSRGARARDLALSSHSLRFPSAEGGG